MEKSTFKHGKILILTRKKKLNAVLYTASYGWRAVINKGYDNRFLLSSLSVNVCVRRVSKAQILHNIHNYFANFG